MEQWKIATICESIAIYSVLYLFMQHMHNSYTGMQPYTITVRSCVTLIATYILSVNISHSEFNIASYILNGYLICGDNNEHGQLSQFNIQSIFAL